MKIIFDSPVCPHCQSAEVVDHNQRDSYRKGDPENRFWSTRAEREADPDIVINPTQRCLWVPDTTWYNCVTCGQDVPADLVKAAWAEFYRKHPGLTWANMPHSEILGAAVGNVAALERVDFK